MSRATPQMRDLSLRLIAHESRGKGASARPGPAAFHVCERLRPQLATLMGSTGFRALLARALAVALAEDPGLRGVQVLPDGSLGGWDAAAAPAGSEAMAEGSVVLVAQLLALLVAFIGEALTLRMVREAWPRLALDDSDFKGDSK